MKTPDIPQECGLHEYDGTWQGGGAYFDIRQRHGRAALAAYCMAVIDVLVEEALIEERLSTKLNDKMFWAQAQAGLLMWKSEHSNYGGFTQ